MLAILELEGLKERVMPYNITEKKLLKDGTFFTSNATMYDALALFVGQG